MRPTTSIVVVGWIAARQQAAYDVQHALKLESKAISALKTALSVAGYASALSHKVLRPALLKLGTADIFAGRT